jgi:hypothetical protein
MKSDVKLGFMEEVAKKVDTFSKESEKRATEYDAVARAMNTALPKIAALMEAIDADLDEEGKLEEIGKEPILLAKYAKSWVNRAIGTLTLMRDTAQDSAQKARGRVTAFGTTLDFLESLYVAEKSNRVRIEAMLASGELLAESEGDDLVLEEAIESVFSPKKGNGSPSRPSGVRPAPSVAQRRKAEEAAERVSQKDIPSTAKTAPEEPEPEPEPGAPQEPVEAAKEPQEVAEAAPEKAEEAPPEAPPEPPAPPPKPEPEPKKAAPPPPKKSEPRTPKKRTRRTVAKERKSRKR